MARRLTVALGHCSERGRKAGNQDFHGACVPAEPQLSTKGVAVALADGISSSAVSHIASETAVRSLLDDYYCTSEAWSVKTAVQRVLAATNSWLHAQSRQSEHRYDHDRGYVCTLSALVIKSTTAHLFHVGDARIYRLQAGALEQLTVDHRLQVSADVSYLSRALGMRGGVEIDYLALPVAVGDHFLLMTDGVYEHLRDHLTAAALDAVVVQSADLDAAARRLVALAFEQGSPDNLTVQIVRIDGLPEVASSELHQQLETLALPPQLSPRMGFDGYQIVRELHVSSRSHVYLAVDEESRAVTVLKLPSIELQEDRGYLERLLTEEWIARRLNNPHLINAAPPARRRNYLYTAMEFVDGQTLTQWMIDHPAPAFAVVRDIVEQIAKGLRALHRLEIVHQDLRPDNIMIDRTGTVRIIDFGSVRVAGLIEQSPTELRQDWIATAQYIAPEYFLGEAGSYRADIFALGVITYQLLSNALPYGTDVAQARTRLAQSRLRYRPLARRHSDAPPWVDDVLRKATHPDPRRRYQALSEFTYELRTPSRAFLNRARAPLMERDPVRFWQGISLLLALLLLLVAVRG